MRHRLVLGVLVPVGGLLLAACSGTSTGPVGPADPASSAATDTPYSHASQVAPHIMILMMEDRSYGTMTGNPEAPYIDSLARGYLRATASYGRGHNSLTNYLELVSGHAYESAGTSADCDPADCGTISGNDIAGQLDAAGIAWKAFMGDMPTDCDTSNAGGKGGYGVRHNPFVYFPAGRTSTECANDVPAAGMLSALNSSTPPDFAFFSPNICENGGGDASCSTIASGDSFLKQTIPAIMATSWYRDNGTIILTWDESVDSDTSGSNGDNGGQVLTISISKRTQGASTFASYLDSAGILRTVEHAYGLGYLGDAANSNLSLLPLGTKNG